jgi:hypothetical protein
MLWSSQVGARKDCQGISNADVRVVVHAAARIGRHRVPVVTGEIKLLIMSIDTGAGVSAESGVPTFRGSGGLWRTWNATDLGEGLDTHH